MGDVVLPPSACTTNSTPEIMGKIALPVPPATNPPVLMGEISVTPQK